MSEKYLISVDLGTMGTKAALVNTCGEILSKTLEESKLYYPKSGWVEQDPEEIFQSAVNTISYVVNESGVDPNKIEAIGISGQMAGIMGIDKNWNAVTHYDSWLDNRCQKYVKLLKEKAEDKYIRSNGMPITIAHAAKILWWKEEKPEIYKKIDKFIMPGAYVAGRMSNLESEEAFIDYTYLHFTGLADAENITWSKKMESLTKISLEKLPKIVSPEDIIGYLTQKVANKCGLKTGIPIIAGAGDTAVSFLGTGLTEPGILIDIAGTASVFSCCVDDYRPDIENKTLLFPRSIQKEYWYPLSYIGGGGLCLRWFRDTFASAEKKLALNENVSTYEILNEMAEEVSVGSEGLIFIPHLAGRTFPTDSKIKGDWFGFSWKHTKAHFYRSILESIAFEYKYYFEIIKRLFPETEFKEVRVLGGGSNSDLWNQIKADVLGIRYKKINEDNVGLIGMAMTTAKAIGLINSVGDVINNIVHTTKTYYPREEYYEKYSQYANLYHKLINNLDSSYNELEELNSKKYQQEEKNG